MDRSVIIKILEAGCQAPSGDNAQPWKFHIRGDIVDLINSHNLDHPFFNFRQRGTYMAHGAVIENMLQRATALGYAGTVATFPAPHDLDFIARISFARAKPTVDTLAPYITERHTNRKPSLKKPVSDEQIEILRSTADEHVSVYVLADTQKIKSLGSALSVTERVALESEELHHAFFGGIVWTESEEQQKKCGLYLKTMELPPPIRGIFRLIRHWNINRWFIKLGFAKLAAKANAQLYTSSPALACVAITGDRNEDYVAAGRVMERLWLTATKLGLSVHPITGALYLMMRIKAGEPSTLSPEHIKLITDSYHRICDAFDLSHETTIPMLFRLGYSKPASARSSKRAAEIESD